MPQVAHQVSQAIAFLHSIRNNMAIQCTPENIQQMMLALQTSFGLDENARKQASFTLVCTFKTYLTHCPISGHRLFAASAAAARIFPNPPRRHLAGANAASAFFSLDLISNQAPTPDIASSAAISLKNLCKKHWANDDSTDFVICDGDKQFLKASMLAGAHSSSAPSEFFRIIFCRNVRVLPSSLRISFRGCDVHCQVRVPAAMAQPSARALCAAAGAADCARIL